MQSMIDNLINGNISDARKLARRFRQKDIADKLRFEFGWSKERSLLAALFLKTGDGFQAYCDAK